MSAGGADLNNCARQNIARQYAANFSKNDAREPLSHHLVQNAESVLVTTTVDLVPPRGDGGDRSGDNVDPEFEPRGFFADQFEVRRLFFSIPICFFLPQFHAPPGSRGFAVGLFTSYDLEHAHDPVTARVVSVQKELHAVVPQSIRSLTNNALWLSVSSARGWSLRPRACGLMTFLADDP